MTTLAFVDTAGGRPTADSLGLLAALARLGTAPTAIVLGDVADATVAVLAGHGAADVVAFAGEIDRSPAAALATAVTDLAAGVDSGFWFAPTTTVTTEAAATVAARLGAGLWWRLTGLGVADDGRMVARQIATDAGASREVSWSSPWGVGLVRTHALAPEPVGVAAPIPVTRRHLATDDRAPVVTERRPAAGAGSGLADAEVIVAAGRGIGSPDRLDLVRELAALIGGTAGVSLPLVEAGWAPRAMQVGQTGTVVSPHLYLACGISGQIQHRVGMERSHSIIAINTDPDAPIMSFCDLAVVADVGDVLPQLIAALRGG